MQSSHHDFTNRSPRRDRLGTYLSTLVLASLDFLYVDQANRAHLASCWTSPINFAYIRMDRTAKTGYLICMVNGGKLNWFNGNRDGLKRDEKQLVIRQS